MDYSASIHDVEQAAEASPWGNSPSSSPRQNRETFGPLADPPANPFRYPSQTSNNGLSDDGGFGPSDGDFRRPDTASTVSAAESVQGSQSQDSTSSQHHNPETQGYLTGDQGPPPPPQQEGHPGPQYAQQPQEGIHQQPKSRPNSQQARRPQPQYKLQAKITGLERTGRKDPILRFDVHTNLPRYRTTQYRDVRRLHSEFIKLAEHLISANPEAMVPAVPPALTSAGAGTDEDEARVKGLMQRWFNYVCSSDVLIRDEEMQLFVESDFGYSPVVKKKQPATGVRRKILKQFAPPPDDTPELAEARPIVKLFYLGAMDAGHKVDKLVKSRRGLGLSEADFGVKLGSMNVQELHQGLANAYRKLGKVIQMVGDCHAAQATAEATTIGDPFQYHSQDAFIVKETLTNRQILIREFLQAQEASRNRLNAADRLKASTNVRREKVDEAIASLDEARQTEKNLYEKTTRVTHNLVHERRKWFARTATDLRLSIREYVLREIEAERRTLALLESVRPDIRAIDASGGLSRLGRESHPTVRRASALATSQGPKGDAWSGVPRRTDTISRSVSGSFVAGIAGGDDVGVEGGEDGEQAGRARALSGGRAGNLPGLAEEDDEDRVDARNAASRLATSTF
ncbi:putative vacuolar protein sorting-associated protein 17 [Echria macrotheca]|uniref:Vacuolar protein sorting-associated protein 17 n=1 Tax=Echria macrotheca TaxID=438768 RepID=A0AAJ0F6M2_9PEZI|nr:putative vacuolar protein sorting-associated protein 17 [Echria macrotheca]